MKKFCVMTTGRAGSTSFMNALAAFDDISVPSKQVDCPDNELVKLHSPSLYWADYGALAGFAITDDTSLVRAFYASNEDAGFAGFKTMPNRHPRLWKILQTHKPQMICIYRRDVASTVASFIAARDRDSWRRSGEPQTYQFTFTKNLRPRIDAHLNYLVRGLDLIARLPGAIRLAFEDLCDPAFEEPALDRYFGRPVRLLNPRPPVHGSSYVGNWQEFVDYVSQRLRAAQRGAAQQ